MITSNFIQPLAGGLLIGAAASLLLWLNGRLAGVSSIVGGAVSADPHERHWRLAFIAGLIAGAAALYALHGAAPQARAGFPTGLLAFAGMLVGYGTALANGCTSGHGVCGLARLSPRSLVATASFLATGIVTALLVRHGLGVQ
ncbi:YeeE/YedE family protein [Niveibacterium sp.]|uniref:YeeE/YedE family protein n=1 Tax=Niveibacterium sp. TaxID=2017444 RepID=UPI0035B2C4A3